MKKFLWFLIVMVLGMNLSVASAQDALINVLYVNDTHSNLQAGFGRDTELKGKSGGIARAVSVVGYAKMQDPEALFLHAGDLFIGDLSWYLWYGVPELGILQTIGLDAMTIGNHEFDATTEGLVGILQAAKAQDISVPLLSANLIPTPETAGEALADFYQESIVKEVHGVKVGIFGMTSGVAMTTSLSLPDVVVNTEYVEVAQEQVIALKEAGCKVIIFLSHIGMMGDKAVAQGVDGINVIIGAHDHLVTETPEIIQKGSGKNTYIVSAGSYYHNVGSLQIEVKNGEFFGLESAIIPLDENIPEEPNTVAFLSGILAEQPEEIQAMFNVQVAQCETTFEEKEPAPLVAGVKSTDVGCLVTSAYMAWGQTDVAFTTCGLTSQPLYAGPIVANDVFRMLGYGVNEFNGVGYQMVKFSIKGEYLKACIDSALSFVQADNDDEFLPQAAGMEITYYTKDTKNSSILINGEPLDPNKEYSVTTTMFVQAFVQSMLEFPIDPYLGVEEISEYEIVLGYIMGQQLINPADYKCEKVIAPVNERNPQIIKKDLIISPNPVNESARVELNIDSPGTYTVDAFNMSNLSMTHIGDTYLDYGNGNYAFNVSHLPSGSYVIRVKNGTKMYFGKFTVVK